MAAILLGICYLLPLPLFTWEWSLRAAKGLPDAAEFFGPSLCSAAIGLCIPLMRPKLEEGAQSGWDKVVCALGVIVLFLVVVAWPVVLLLSIGGQLPPHAQNWVQDYDVKIWIGGSLYGTAVVLSVIKELL